MNTYFIPTDTEFVEDVAKAIARNRVHKEASSAIREILGKDMEQKNISYDRMLDLVFEKLWSGNSPTDKKQKENYMNDAMAAISAINLKLITST